MDKLKLSSPWVTYYRELKALFGDDPDITMTLDEDNCAVKIFINNEKKAEALQILLPSIIKFGNVTLTVDVIPANTKVMSKVELFRTAFEGNPAFRYCATLEDVLVNPITYFVFKNKVVQYYNDDLGDVNGNKSTLYQEIAKNIFGDIPGIFYCTEEIEEKENEDAES